MRKFTVAGMVAIAALVPLTFGAPSASGAVAEKSRPPVKLSGRVNDQGTATATGGTITITQSDYGFSPTYVKVPGGATSLTVTVKNTGQTQHTFTVRSPAIDRVLNPGETATVTVNVPGPGAFAFYCRFHRSLGMQGAFFDKKGAKLIGPSGARRSSSSGGSMHSGGSPS
jgi:plastocyanin